MSVFPGAFARHAAIAFLALVPGPGLAAEGSESATRVESTEARCHRYAETAVDQQMDNLGQGCGLTGGPWHADYQAHYDWCLDQSADTTGEEMTERRAALEGCTPTASDEDRRCHRYARTGVRQQQENRRFSCGFAGAAWHADYEGHFSWCQSVSEKRTGEEMAMRADKLAGCR